MLDKLRDRALHVIAATPTCILSTTGPAGLQASVVSCRVHAAQSDPEQQQRVFVFIPVTSDHLFNLEHCPEVMLTTPQWQLRGLVGADQAAPPEVTVIECQQQVMTFQVTPVQMHIEPTGEGSHRETIDFCPRFQQREVRP
ncbi:MAG: hypothetical protein HY741_08015 [Chloroflexi bacterium]|nr:hypothetical protein [Chloroflexota bacterium]